MEEIKKHFVNSEKVVSAIYANGGISVGGWGYLSGGYGGGIEQDQALLLIHVDGYISAMQKYAPKELAKLLQAINEEVEKIGLDGKEPPFKKEWILNNL